MRSTRLVRREAIGLADLDAQRQAEAVDVADLGMAALQLAQSLQEMRAFLHDHRFVVGLGEHRHGLETDRRAERVRREGRVGRAGRKDFRRDQRLLRPQPGERVEAVRQRLAEHQDVGRDAEVLDCPELAGAENPSGSRRRRAGCRGGRALASAWRRSSAAESRSRRCLAPPRRRTRRTRTASRARPRRRCIRSRTGARTA